MRLLKPGKIAPTAKTPKDRPAQSDTSGRREVWDDFNNSKNRKREYEKGAGNRMFPKPPQPKKGDSLSFQEGEAASREGGEEGDSNFPNVDFDALEERLGHKFSDRELLVRALTHRSALGVKERADYERLEFLGDAVLDLSVAHLLSDLHPEAREGELSKMRAALVNTQALAKVARELDIGPYIRLGRGELSSGGAERPSILADVLEAVVGAVYRDSSYERALTLIEAIFGSSLEQVTPFDPKTELQEVLHVSGSEPPSYLLELVEGPEHAPTFVTVVQVDGEVVGRGRGATKKSAQQAAAAEALARMVPDVPLPELAEGQTFILEDSLYVIPTGDLLGLQESDGEDSTAEEQVEGESVESSSEETGGEGEPPDGDEAQAA